MNHNHKHVKFNNNIPIIYTDKYNISAGGIEKLHPFDSQKYRNIINCLKAVDEYKYIEQRIFEPEKCDKFILNLGMTKLYQLKICFSIFITMFVEVPLCCLPGFFIRSNLLDPMLFATQGTIDGGCMALDKGYAINLSGGYHHAHQSSGGGFCIYPDISLTIKHLRLMHNLKKFLILDLDAHQGNGYERDFINDENVQIIDFYNHLIYPCDNEAKKSITIDVRVEKSSDKQYLDKMEKYIPSQLDQFKPEFVLYNAGTDCLEHDPLGNMNLSDTAIIKRDELVFQYCLQRKIPLLMVLSGGYQKSNAQIIANSIINLGQKFKILK